MPPSVDETDSVQRPLPEQRYTRQLEALEARDEAPKPEGWRLSPRAVADFVTGLDAPLEHPDGDEVEVERKFYGDDPLIERAVVTLTTQRGLMLVGEPGTAKTMLSELFAAAISGDSTLAIQGSAGTTENQVTYGWNYAELLADGPSTEALVPAPFYLGMTRGKLVRFEEITRCAPEVQDVILSALSDRVLAIPELSASERIVQAQPGFNLVATANTRDKGVRDMSAALKRRLNFETVRPIEDASTELDLVQTRANEALDDESIPVRLERDVAELLVTTFRELRQGSAADGERVDSPSTPMSTAEAVDVSVSSGLHAHYYGDGRIEPQHLVRHLVGTVLKDDPDDRDRLEQYFSQIVRRRADRDDRWSAWYEARTWI